MSWMRMESNAAAAKPATLQAAASPGATLALPEDAMVIVPVRNLVLFPGMILPVTIGRESSVPVSYTHLTLPTILLV